MCGDEGYVTLTPEGIEEFIGECGALGYLGSTLESYRNALRRAYRQLPEGKRIDRETLAGLKEELLGKGFSPNTVNLTLSVCNTWLAYIGRGELQETERLDKDRRAPELTRNEYLRLLKIAKLQGEEKKYLLTKLFAMTGISAQELETVTVEAVQGNELSIPEVLTKELMEYAGRRNITEGPLFLNSEGQPLTRTTAPKVLKYKTARSGVSEDKITAKNLGRLRDALRERCHARLTPLVERSMDRQMEEEEEAVGWSR